MNQSQFQRRVGVFVFLCLVLVGALLLAFGKGASFFAQTYELRMGLKNVGGLKERSAVFLAGVQVGDLKSVELAPDGRSVLLHLRILRKYPIHQDAEFVVEQIGVLGDQFVSIYPGANLAPLLQNGAFVQGRESFNLQEVARSADDLLKQLTQTLGEVREGVTNVKRGILDPTTLSNLAAMVANFRKVSENAIVVTETASLILQTNAEPIHQSASNLVRFSGRLENVAQHLDETILSNRTGLQAAITHFQEAGGALQHIASGLDAGRGVAGSLLQDATLQAQMSATFSNLALLSSNLNRYGLLYKPRQATHKTSTSNVYPGKRP